MSRSVATLAWLDAHDETIRAHPGAALPERELLRGIINGATGTGGIMSAAYRALIEFKVPSLIQTQDARGYAHEVMFGSDFGLHSVAVPAEVEGLLDSAALLHGDDTDTLGEILITAHLIGHEMSRTAFTAAWDAIPWDFENYHVLLVGGILFALTGD